MAAETTGRGTQPRLQHDGTLTLATAGSRKSVKWKNRQLNLSELLHKLQQPTVTQETPEEYRKMSKAQQSELKDVGGFVGGTLKGGRRTADAVQWRQLLTLDADHVTGDLWGSVQLLLDDCAAILYSTHSHTSDSPRLRLLIPLNRVVTPDEYAAIGRRVAADIGIDQFDDTTFEPHRLMFWPSHSAGAEYVLEHIDAPWLDADSVLGRYDDWTDALTWPVSSRQREQPHKLAEKQGDPTEKTGLIGAFCRAYDVEDAIQEFLSDEYEEHSAGRYTYRGGSTAGGLVIYDEGRFAYSHHGTDPLSGQLVNAFDLVRIHMFGAADADAEPGTRVTRLPSFAAMQEQVQELPEVREQLAAERLQRAEDDFLSIEGDDEEEDDEPESQVALADEDKRAAAKDKAKDKRSSWMRKLTFNKAGELEQSRTNLQLILEHDPHLAGKIALDTFSNKAQVLADLPWRKKGRGIDHFQDIDDAGLRNYLERIYNISAVQKTEDALAEAMHRHAFHPVREYLERQSWDGVPRVDSLLIDYLGAPDTELTRAVTRKTLAAAVARVYEPGCKFDYMLTLLGPQGIGKSSLFRVLAGEWFSDSLTSVTGKEAYEQLQGAWIVEMGELSATRRADVESIKHFLTKQVDRFRVAYGRRVTDFPRQCIFIGTTNDDEFLRDQTGNRRFWTVEARGETATKRWQEIDRETAGQVWAEAVHYYSMDEPLHLPPELEAQMGEEQKAYTEDNPLATIIQEHLDKPVPENWNQLTIPERKDYWEQALDFDLDEGELVQRDRFCMLEVWCELMDGTPGNIPAAARRELRDALRALEGWKKYGGNDRGRLRFGPDIGVQRAYIRIGSDEKV